MTAHPDATSQHPAPKHGSGKWKQTPVCTQRLTLPKRIQGSEHHPQPHTARARMGKPVSSPLGLVLVHAACCESRRRGVGHGHLVTSCWLSAAWMLHGQLSERRCLCPDADEPARASRCSCPAAAPVRADPAPSLAQLLGSRPGGGFPPESCVRSEPPRPGRRTSSPLFSLEFALSVNRGEIKVSFATFTHSYPDLQTFKVG